MNTTLETTEDSTISVKMLEPSFFWFRVVCERCHHTIFYFGKEDVEPVYILCDKCASDD